MPKTNYITQKNPGDLITSGTFNTLATMVQGFNRGLLTTGNSFGGVRYATEFDAAKHAGTTADPFLASAIQNAINDIGILGGKTFLPAVGFKADASVSIPNATTSLMIEGAGQYSLDYTGSTAAGGAFLFPSSAFPSGNALLTNPVPLTVSQLSENLTIRDLGLVCTKNANTSGAPWATGLILYGVIKSLVSNVTVTDPNGVGIGMLAASNGNWGAWQSVVDCLVTNALPFPTNAAAGNTAIGFDCSSVESIVARCYTFGTLVGFRTIGGLSSNVYGNGFFGCWSDSSTSPTGVLVTDYYINAPRTELIGCNNTRSVNLGGLTARNIGGGTFANSVRVIGGWYMQDQDSSQHSNVEQDVRANDWIISDVTFSGASQVLTNYVFNGFGSNTRENPIIIKDSCILNNQRYVVANGFFNFGGVGWYRVHDVAGFNPKAISGQITPAVPASGTGWKNTYPYVVRIYVLTAAGASYTITDIFTWATPSIPMSAGQEITLNPGDTITPTYTTLTWQFYGT